MATFYISRHGQTLNNLNRRMSGWIDTPLTDAGVENAKASAEKLRDKKIGRIITSDLGRAFTTGYIIARSLGFVGEIERAPELREVNYGDIANMTIDDVIAGAYPLNDETYVPPNGESLGHMQQRVLEFIGKVGLQNDGQNVLFVGHEGTINSVFAASSGITIGEADSKNRFAHDFVAEFQVADGAITEFKEVTS